MTHLDHSAAGLTYRIPPLPAARAGGAPLAAPVIAATRLRGGNAASSRGAASFATQAVGTARATGCTGILIVRADSAFYSAA